MKYCKFTLTIKELNEISNLLSYNMTTTLLMKYN